MGVYAVKIIDSKFRNSHRNTGTRETEYRDTNTERIEPQSQGITRYHKVSQEPERQETEKQVQREMNHRVKGIGTGIRETGDRDTNTE